MLQCAVESATQCIGLCLGVVCKVNAGKQSYERRQGSKAMNNFCSQFSSACMAFLKAALVEIEIASRWIISTLAKTSQTNFGPV